MTLSEAKGYRFIVGMPVQPQDEAINRLITDIEVSEDSKNINFTLDNGKTYNHRLVNEPCLFASRGNLVCSWYPEPVYSIDEAILPSGEKYREACERLFEEKQNRTHKVDKEPDRGLF